jgi:hypothetical protein
MSDNGGFGPATARTFMVASSLLAAVSLTMPWFGQYPGKRALVTELMDQWSGWGLAGESAYDGHVPLDLWVVVPLVVAVLALPVLAGMSGPGPHQGWITGVASGLGLALLLFSWWMGGQVGGRYGDDYRWLHPLFGIAVFRIALVAYVVSAARVSWLMGDRSAEHQQVA